jgi:hypothetical protein
MLAKLNKKELSVSIIYAPETTPLSARRSALEN